MLQRAYSLLEIKSVDEDLRIIEGFATTPSPDRMGDVLDPKGADFQLPMPLLWQHRQSEPIGQVLSAETTTKGIHIRARIAKDVLPRIDEAWALIKSGLVRGLSVGFTADSEKPPKFNPDTGGLHFNAWKWLELSAVTIPANAEATITAIKSIAERETAALGPRPAPIARVSARDRAQVVRASHVGAKSMKKTIADQIRDFENTRAVKVAERDGIMDTAADKHETLDAAQTEQYDTLDTEIKSIDEHLKRLRVRETENKAAATEVNGATMKAASDARGGASTQVRVESRMPDGLEFAAAVICKAASFIEMQKGNWISPIEIAKQRYPDNQAIQLFLQQKTAVAGGTTTDANFAASLLAPAQVLESAFLEYLRPRTLIDRFGTVQNGVQIPSLLKVPFNVKVQSQTSGASGGWVGEGKAKPVTKFNTTDATLLFTKIACISVITEELARFSRPGAEQLVRNELAKAVIARMDTDFIDPAKASSAGVNPASITYGLVALSSAGISAANVLTDIQALVAPFLLNGYDISNLVILLPNTLALTLSLMQNSLGQDSFKGMTAQGGSIAGIPVLASQYLASGASYGNMVVCLSAENIALADDGSVTVDASREASIEMSDAPAGDATAGTGASMVSMWQTNSIALRAERGIGWKKLRSTAVTYMDDVNWGSIGSPV